MKRTGGTDFDVAVMGGGPAGAATALALARLGRSVVLTEQSSYAEPRIGETLPPRIRTLLGKLGVWEQFLSADHLRAPGILSAWGASTIHRNDFILNPYGDGWHVDRRRFDSMLSQSAAGAGAVVYNNATAACRGTSGGDWQIDINTRAGHRVLRAAFVVDATGRRSSFARRQGIRRVAQDRLIGAIGFGRSNAETATLIESVEDGWWYAAALPDGRSVVAYMTDSDLYGRARKSVADFWRQALRRTVHVQSFIDPSSVDGSVRLVPASVSRLETPAGRNWLAVGDAAFTLDPLSGQGVYYAIQSALCAAQAIAQSSPRAHHEQMDRAFLDHQRGREHFYETERRWTGSAFWRRRQKKEGAHGCH